MLEGSRKRVADEETLAIILPGCASTSAYCDQGWPPAGLAEKHVLSYLSCQSESYRSTAERAESLSRIISFTQSTKDLAKTHWHDHPQTPSSQHLSSYTP